MSAPCSGAADQHATPSVDQPTLGSILRGWLPTALAGTKWLGGRVLRVLQQIADCGTDACVVNGAAWGRGFGFIEPGRDPVSLADKPELCAFLAGWLDAEK